MLLPNIERDGNHSVEDDDVGPECEEGREGSFVAILSGKEDYELWTFIQLPKVVSYCQDGTHDGQKTKNLQGKFSELRTRVTGRKGELIKKQRNSEEWLHNWAPVKGTM